MFREEITQDDHHDRISCQSFWTIILFLAGKKLKHPNAGFGWLECYYYIIVIIIITALWHDYQLP